MKYFESELDVHGEPSVLPIVQKWRLQRLEDEEQHLLQERVFNAEEHFRAMCAACSVTNNNAEAHYWRMKNARAELVTCIEQFFHMHAHVRTNLPGCRPLGLCNTRLSQTIVL